MRETSGLGLVGELLGLLQAREPEERKQKDVCTGTETDLWADSDGCGLPLTHGAMCSNPLWVIPQLLQDPFWTYCVLPLTCCSMSPS